MSDRAECPSGEVNVHDVMAGVRERVRARRAEGHFSAEDLDRLIQGRLRSYGLESEIDPLLLQRLLRESHDWNIAADYEVRSHRGPLLGPVLKLAKLLTRPFVRLYTDHVVKRQAQINLYLLYGLRDAVARVTVLEAELRALRSAQGQADATGRHTEGGP